jgi:hypothetical protein
MHAAILREVERQDAEEASRGGHDAEALRRRLRQLDAELTEGYARLVNIDRQLLAGFQKRLKGVQAERDRLAGELARAEAGPSYSKDLKEQARAAVDALKRLDATAEPEALKELLAEVVTKVECWFVHQKQGKRTRCRFAKALVWLREDVALVYSIVASSSAEV